MFPAEFADPEQCLLLGWLIWAKRLSRDQPVPGAEVAPALGSLPGSVLLPTLSNLRPSRKAAH